VCVRACANTKTAFCVQEPGEGAKQERRGPGIPLTTRKLLSYFSLHLYIYIYIYRVSQEECARLRESVPYVIVYRYNPKHLYPKLNGYGDNDQRKVRSSCGST